MLAPDPGVLDVDMVVKSLAQVLGQVVAEKTREWELHNKKLAAETNALTANLRAKQIEFCHEIKEFANSEIARIHAAAEQIKNGVDGKDGKDVDMVEVDSIITERVQKAVEAKGDPRGISNMWIEEDGDLIAQMTDDMRIKLGKVVGDNGKDGKDVDREFVAEFLTEQVTKAFANAPVPKDGKDGKDGIDGKDGRDADIDEVVLKVAEILPVPKDGRDGIDGKDGKDGVDGKDVDMATVEAMLQKSIVSNIPIPKDGKDGRDGIDGKDGESVDRGFVETFLTEQVLKSFANVPIPQDGKDGKDGRDGIDGKDGKDADMDLVDIVVAERVEKAVASIRVPEDGKDGVDGKDGINGKDGIDGKDGRGIDTLEILDSHLVVKTTDGMAVDLGLVVGQQGDPGTPGAPGDPGAPGAPGEPGKAGLDGRDGIGLSAGIIDREGDLILTLSDGSVQKLGKVIGKDGRDGKDGDPGRDGLGFDDLDVLYDGNREMMFRLAKGDVVKEFKFAMPIVLYQGIFNEKKSYRVGDSVTYGGSTWIAKKVTGSRPGTNEDWQLAVKRGVDGKKT